VVKYIPKLPGNAGFRVQVGQDGKYPSFFGLKPWTRQKIAPAFSAYYPSMDIND